MAFVRGGDGAADGDDDDGLGVDAADGGETESSPLAPAPAASAFGTYFFAAFGGCALAPASATAGGDGDDDDDDDAAPAGGACDAGALCAAAGGAPAEPPSPDAEASEETSGLFSHAGARLLATASGALKRACDPWLELLVEGYDAATGSATCARTGRAGGAQVRFTRRGLELASARLRQSTLLALSGGFLAYGGVRVGRALVRLPGARALLALAALGRVPDEPVRAVERLESLLGDDAEALLSGAR